MSGAGRTALAVLLSLAVPGLGHAAAGDRRRGATLFLIVLATFAGGLALGGRLATPAPGRPLSVIPAVGARATGILDLAARGLGLGRGERGGARTEYGDAWLQSASAMSLLLAVDLVARPGPRGAA